MCKPSSKTASSKASTRARQSVKRLTSESGRTNLRKAERTQSRTTQRLLHRLTTSWPSVRSTAPCRATSESSRATCPSHPTIQPRTRPSPQDLRSGTTQLSRPAINSPTRETSWLLARSTRFLDSRYASTMRSRHASSQSTTQVGRTIAACRRTRIAVMHHRFLAVRN